MTGLILVTGLAVLFVVGVPIAVAMALSAAIGIGVGGGTIPLMVVAQRMISGADSFHLMAVPLFVYAGLIMERGGISERIIALADVLVGWLPGGLAAVTITAAMFFAGISGSAAADTAAVGAILIPAMKRAGYDSAYAAAVQASGGSIGVVIPPSIPMILFGYLTGASIGKLFMAGVLPGLLIGASLVAVATSLAHRHGYAPTAPFSGLQLWRAVRRSAWAIGAPVIILGGILGGVFTATESAAVAVVYALAVGMGIYRRIGIRDLPPMFTQGAVTSAIVMFIIAAASVFSWLAAIEDLPARLAELLHSITNAPVLLLLCINLLLLIVGTVVETTAALILLVPTLAAMAPELGIGLIHLGVIVVVNLAIGMLTPPMGICLIVSGAISKDGLGAVSRRALPFIGVLVIDLMIITFWRPMTDWLPRWLSAL